MSLDAFINRMVESIHAAEARDMNLSTEAHALWRAQQDDYSAEASLEMNVEMAWDRLGRAEVEMGARRRLGASHGLDIPIAPGRIIRLSQLSGRSWGSGQDRRGTTHAYLFGDLRLPRGRSRPIHTIACGRRGGFDLAVDPVAPTDAISCPGCLALLDKAAQHAALQGLMVDVAARG